MVLGREKVDYTGIQAPQAVLALSAEGIQRREAIFHSLDRHAQVIAAKGVVAPRGAYEPIAARILLVNTPGATAADPAIFTYQRRRRPLYPFERAAAYS